MKRLGALLGSVLCVACGSSASSPDAPAPEDAGSLPIGDASSDGGWSSRDGGFVVADGGLLRADRFATSVVSFAPGECGGFGAPNMPGVVLGPPAGAGGDQGSLDVVSLGNGGEIVLSFAPNAIVDGPGADFIVFENAFFLGGGPEVFAEPGEVSVSDDGQTWKTYPCTATKAPWGACAGSHPVYASATSGVSPVDPQKAGGDPFDLADVGLTRAQYVRIKDKGNGACSGSSKLNTNGFDLDAVSIVNAAQP